MEAAAKESMCQACPNRSAVSKLLARIGLSEVASDCVGPTKYDRAYATLDVRQPGEDAPQQYTSVSGSLDSDVLTYMNVTWADSEKLCSKEPVTLHEDEHPYLRDTDPSNPRIVTVTGPEEAADTMRGNFAIGSVLGDGSDASIIIER